MGMKFSRRDFVHAGCAVGVTTLIPNRADAFWHGSAAAPQLNQNRATINIIHGADKEIYANLAKGFSFPAQDPTTVSSDGYPLSTPAAAINGNPNMPQGYYGDFVWKWTGQGSMQILSSPAMVVKSGGTALGLGTSAGDFAQGANITALSQTAPRVQFAFGWNIQSISNNGSGLIRITTKANYLGGSSYTGTVVNIAGANANTGANGTWTMSKVDAQTFDLIGSTFSNAQASAAGTAIFAANNLSVRFHNAGTYSGMGGLVWCRAADESAVDGGQIIDNTIISQLQYLANGGVSLASRGWLRFMDVNAVQGSFECDFAQRVPSTNVTYVPASGFLRSGYWAGAITNGGSDNYTCSDPSNSVWNGTSYIDNAIVQGAPSATNTGGTPTLAVGGHPAKPVYYWNDGVPPFVLALTGVPPSPGTDVMQYTFTASWLNSGTPYVFSYATQAGDTTLATLNGHLATALQADATLATNKIFVLNPQNGQSGSGPFVYPRTAQANRMTVSYSSGPAISSVLNMRTAIISASSNGTFVYNYLLDGWIYKTNGMSCSIPFEAIVEMCNRVGAHCWFNIGTTKGPWVTAVTQFFGDSVSGLTNGLRFGAEAYNEVWNSGSALFSPLQGLGSTLGWSFTNDSPNYSYTALRTVQYSALAKTAWTGKGRNASDFYVFSMSAEFDASVSGAFDNKQLKGQSLNTSSFPIYASFGGLNGSGTSPDYSTAGSRPVDITTATGLAPYWGSPWWNTTASSVGGPITQHVPWLQASLDFANGNTSTAFASLTNQFNGTTTRAAGSSGAISLASYASGAFTNEEALAAQYDAFRVSNSIPKLGIMHYEGAPQWAVGNNGVNGTNLVTDTGPLLAQLLQVSGSISAAGSTYTNGTYTNVPITGGSGTGLTATITVSGNVVTSVSMNVAASNGYAPADVLSAAAANIGGTGSGFTWTVSSVLWQNQSVSAYTVSGLDDKVALCNQVLALMQGWKNDTDHNGNPAGTSSYKSLIKTSYYQALKNISGANRETKPAQYGYQASTWGFFPVDYNLANPYQNYDAMHEWNAGG